MFRTLVLITIAALVLSACGRRGALEAPGEPESAAVAAPAAEPVGPAPMLEALSPGALEPPEAKPTPVPERRFLLDFLI